MDGPAGKTGGLQIGAAAGAGTLTPEQKRFNSLTRQIEQARETLRAWQEQIPLYRQAHADVLGPLFKGLDEARRAWIHAIDRQLAQGGWTRTEQRTLRELLCDAVSDLLAEQDEPDPALKALFDQHNEVDYDTEQQQVRLAMKDMVETMTGLDLGTDQEIDSDAELFQRLQKEMAAREAAEAAHAEARDQAKAGRRKTAADKRREAEAQQATQSVREVFRKLASALHPDRETDPGQKAAKNALMQQANQAYAANDLLALLALQLKIEQVDADHLARASAEQIKRYNKVLAEQLGELRQEILLTEEAFRHDAGLEIGWGLKPAKLALLLKDQSRQLQGAIATVKRELVLLADKGDTKRWLKLVRQRQREMDREDGFF